MSISSQAESEGIDSLFDAGGESITFRGVTESAVINRPTDLAKARPGMADRNVRDTSEAEIRIADLSSAPKVGEHFTDGNALRHRIETVHRIGLVYRMTCKVEVVP